MAKRVRATDLLRKTRRLKEELQVFRRSARAFWSRLDPLIPPAEIEAMTSPEANILGTLEQLLNDDLGDLVRQLNEVNDLISGCLSGGDVSSPGNGVERGDKEMRICA